MVSDPIADMLTRIRNGGQARLGRISMPHSKLKMEIARVLAARGFIAGFAGDEDAKKPQMTIEQAREARQGGELLAKVW